MFKIKTKKKALKQIAAIIEKNVRLELCVKARFITTFINPLIQLFLSFIIFRVMFSININYKFGYWISSNFFLFILLAFCIQFSSTILYKYRQLFFEEKYWKTLSAMMVAPINQITLLIGVLATEFVMVGIPIILTYIIALIFFPIPLYYIFLNILVFISIFITFAAIGLLIGAFTISKEGLVHYSSLALRILLLLSCLNFPVQFFPEIIQFFIKLNPLYYFFDLFRLTWYLGLNFEMAIINISILHIVIVLSVTILSPIISIYLFKKIYQKFGIRGY